jgi:hypothetical protein
MVVPEEEEELVHVVQVDFSTALVTRTIRLRHDGGAVN